ncbi:MAG: transferase [Deltaproteobacteria bacterium]|nr:transferase [Deltaproteobacteria bacterium]
MKTIKIYDTSLRDGTQAEEISFSVEDKILVARKLDELGVHYIEGGWPGSNPKDVQFYKEIKKVRLKNSRVSAFGSTGRPKVKPSEDHNLKALVSSGVGVACIFGKSWDLHVKEALKIPLRENLDLIYDSVTFLEKELDEVFYDAEHFFDGYKANPEYAIKTLKAAADAGADCLVLCDTNGGTLPHEVAEAIKMVQKTIKTPLGIHCHNDSDLAVANSLIAVELGIGQVQGTINGFGERCGNANLCSIIPNLQFKMGYKCLSDSQLARLSETSRFVSEIANLTHNSHLPYVGESAFAHKGGIHVSAVMKKAETYEHIRPELVGNRQRVLISDLSGKSNILFKAKEFGIDIYQFEGAEASFELLMKRVLGTHKKYFNLIGFRVIDEKRKEDEPPIAEATIMVEVGGKVEHTAAVGDGPINAIDNALRKALEKFYPSLKDVKLLDFKVRVLTAGEGTAASVRVLIESGDKTDKWGTVGVSENVIEASWQALVDSIDYKLYKDEKGPKA